MQVFIVLVMLLDFTSVLVQGPLLLTRKNLNFSMKELGMDK